MKIFRWRAIAALAFFFLLLVLWSLLFGERTVKTSLEQAATSSLGTQVDIGSLNINLARSSLLLSGIAIADPFDSTRNLMEANDATVELEIEPLLRRKIVVRNFAMHGVRGGTVRAIPARSVDTSGFAPRALRQLHRFREQLSVPLLSLTPLDTIRSLVLDPGQLRVVQAAQALEQRADSLRGNVTARAAALLQTDIVDSTEALLGRLRGQTARTLGVTGVVRAVSDIRRLTLRVDSVKRAAESLRTAVNTGFDSLVSGTRALDAARQADYAFARSLLALPTFDAPSIGPALFGDVSISTFEKASYWVMLAREHAPPGLRPRARPGPARLRRAGTNIQFATPQSVPNFLLREGAVSLSLGAATGAAAGEYSLRIENLTTEPQILGRPTVFALNRSAPGSDVRQITVTGSLDHTSARMHDVVGISAAGVRLPAFDLPGVPLRLDMGRGTSTLHFELAGDSIVARWSLESSAPQWLPAVATQGAAAQSTLQGLVTRVLAGIEQLQVEARLSGTLAAPVLAVSSTLDREVAASIRSVAGEELERAEARVRAQVDSIAEERLAPVRARIDELKTEAQARIGEVTARIDALKDALAAQLRALGG